MFSFHTYLAICSYPMLSKAISLPERHKLYSLIFKGFCDMNISSGSPPLSYQHFPSDGSKIFRSLTLKIGRTCGIFHLKSLYLWDRVIQYKIVHRAYITPYRLHKIKTSLSLDCWRCAHAMGDFIHIFWSHSAFSVYWMQVPVLSVVQDLSGISIAPSPQICLLGLVEAYSYSSSHPSSPDRDYKYVYIT